MDNVRNLHRILTCFRLVSGLKVNLQKSKILGIGFSRLEVYSMAHSFKCHEGELPLSYLGMLVGGNSSNGQFRFLLFTSSKKNFQYGKRELYP